MDLISLRDALMSNDTTISLVFSRKIRQNQNFISYNAAIKTEVGQKIQDLLLSTVNWTIEEASNISNYNPTGVADGNIEMIGVQDVVGYEDFENSLINASDSDDLEEEADNLTFYTVIIENQALSISYKLIRRIRKFKRLYTKGFAGFFNGDELNEIDTKIIGIDGDIDIIQHGEELLILNHVSIERVFFMEDAFNKKASEMLSLMRKGQYVTNFDEFEEACLTNKRIQRTISKMSHENIDWTRALENFDAVIHTIDVFDLGIEYNQVPNNTLIFDSPEQVLPILRLVRDSYYITTINHNQGTDEKIG